MGADGIENEFEIFDRSGREQNYLVLCRGITIIEKTQT